MSSSLKNKIQRLEQQGQCLGPTGAWARERDQELYGSSSEEELLFFITHGYFPEAAVCTNGPQIRQLTEGKLLATIILERVQ